MSYDLQFKSWQIRKDKLISMKYKLSYIWSHDFEDMIHDPYINSRIKKWRKINSLGNRIIRDSLYGGRVENFQIEYRCLENEEIKYVDFTSLYPYVLKNRRYPVGHPVLITQDFGAIENYFGFVSCSVLPPVNLKIPVLPSRYNNLLLFGLCDKCCQLQQNTDCTHSSEGRKICGTWTTAELQLAVSKGYVVDEIFLIHHYPESDENMFTAYINNWLKYKQEASGWPKTVQTETDKQDYIKMYKKAEGIDLEYKSIDKNEGVRLIAKLMLNSFWGKYLNFCDFFRINVDSFTGKLSQRPNLQKSEIVNDHGRLWAIYEDSKLQITGQTILSDRSVLVSYKYVDERDSSPGKIKNILVIYLTCVS